MITHPKLEFSVVVLTHSKTTLSQTDPVSRKRKVSWALVLYAFNSSTWQAESGGSLSSKPA